MDVILDTCGLLSLIGVAERKLSKNTLDIIQYAEHVYISSCSLFEIATKHKKEKLNISPFKNSFSLWQTIVSDYQMTELSVSAEIFYNSTTLEGHHNDPFDRIIISEAIDKKATVVTYDSLFSSYGVQIIN